MTDTTQDYAGLIESLDHRASTMNGAEPVGAGEGHTYATGYYTTWDRRLDRKAATALRALLERNAALERKRDQLKERVTELEDLCNSLEAQAAELEAVKERRRCALVKALYELERAEAAEAKLAEAERVIDMVEEDPALARALARAYRDKGRE